MDGPQGFDEKSDFRFVIGEKDDLVVLLLYGKVGTREIPVLESCELDLLTKSQHIILINFHDLAIFSATAHQFFVRFQKNLRDHGKLLGLCSMRPDVKSSLTLAGVVRHNEIFDNIPQAWKALAAKLKAGKKQAA